MSIGNIKHHTAPLDASDSSTFNAAESSTISGPDSLSIELQITNPEVQIELLSRQEVPARQKYATDALTVGAMYFRQVQSRIDEQSIESIGKKLIDRANEVVTARGIEIINQLDGLCKQYLSDDGKLASEFSTDAPDSALSRMLARVEHAHKRIADEFSSDNEQSALNRLTNILQSTNSYIQKQPTLDNQDSALNLALKQIDGTQQEILKSNFDLAMNVKTSLAALEARKKELERSPRHGQTFDNHIWKTGLRVEHSKNSTVR